MASVWKHPKSQFWTACFTDKHGRRRKRSTKERSRPRAEKLADEFEAFARGKKTMAQVQRVISDLSREVLGAEMQSVSIAEFLKRWLRSKEGEVSSGTFANYDARLKTLAPFLSARGRTLFSELQREDVLAWRDNEAERISSATVNTALRMLREVLRSARTDGLLAHDPAENVRGLSSRGQVRKRRPFTEAEMQALLREADAEWRSIILFAYYTGQAISDQAKLSWADIDLERRIVRYVRMKTGKPAIVPINDSLYEHILSMSVSDDPAAKVHPKCWSSFARAGNRSNVIGAQFAAIMRKAGLRGKDNRTGKGLAVKRRSYETSFHSLRHTAISDLQKEGVSASVAGDIAGHSSVKSTKIYTHVDDEQKRAAVSKLKKLKIPERDLFDWGKERE